MRNETNPHLRGEVEVLDGRAPRAGWAPLDSEMNRAEDLWIEGNPLELLDNPSHWWQKVRDRREKEPAGVLGLRLRFVLETLPKDAFEFLQLISAIVSGFPKKEDWLFFHAELMGGPEPGVYLAYDNRPPALITSLDMDKSGSHGKLECIPDGPLHVNILYHDPKVDLKSLLARGRVKELLKKLALAHAALDLGRIHELSLARSTSCDRDPVGVSIGLEKIRQEHGAEGGYERLNSEKSG